ncbi:MAG: nucleotide exchange factor GrpE [Verrucomicrobia bacterium]|nr:nucleotide exchange factor GrpE [Verrucomicrobiota bacterium]
MPILLAANDVEAGNVASETVENEQVGELLARLDALTAELEDQRSRHLRAVADLENYRRRALREKDEARRSAAENIFGDMIQVLDNLSLGLDAARQHDQGKIFVQGFEMVFSQMKSIFGQHGLSDINPLNQPFDPNLHEAVSHVPSAEVAEGSVSAVVRIGYKLHDKLLRPATVVVSSGPAAEGIDAGKE